MTASVTVSLVDGERGAAREMLDAPANGVLIGQYA